MFTFFRYILLTLTVTLVSHKILPAQQTFDLNQCIAIALEKNIAVDKAMLTLDHKTLDIKNYKNERLPNLNGFTNMFSNFGQSQDIFGNNARNDNFNSTLGLSSSYSILNNGKLKNSIKRSEKEMEASGQDLALLKREITLKTIEGYLNVLLQKEICKAVDTALTFAEQQFQKVQKSTDLGATSLTILYEAKANYERENEKKRRAHYAVDKAILELKQIMAVEQNQNFEINTELQALSSLQESSYDNAALYASFLQQHPALKKYALLNEALKFDQKAIKAQLYPTIDASLTLGSFYFSNLSTGFGKLPLFNQLRNNFSQQIGLTINIPVFNKNAVKIAVQKNKIQQAENAKQLELEQLTIKQDLEKQLLDLDNYQRQYKLAANVLEVTRKAFELSLKSYEAGRISIYDLSTSRSNLLTLESELIQTKYNALFTQIMVRYLSTGEIKP
ncbi:TolC family protein [Sphingobacterium spiritivorum]|uniref:TolC family protein n=1 Tax=Sphingobacterium spiritivorum TaxID=258 RepID=UPI003DA58525